MSVTTLLAISLGAILTNNFIFSQFLGICPFLGVSKKIDTAVGMGAAVTFVMALASAFCYLINLVLVPLNLAFTTPVSGGYAASETHRSAGILAPHRSFCRKQSWNSPSG